MDHLDRWYKSNISKQKPPPYSEQMWEKAQAFIRRAETIRRLGYFSRVWLMFLILLGTVPALLYRSTSDYTANESHVIAQQQPLSAEVTTPSFNGHSPNHEDFSNQELDPNSVSTIEKKGSIKKIDSKEVKSSSEQSLQTANALNNQNSNPEQASIREGTMQYQSQQDKPSGESLNTSKEASLLLSKSEVPYMEIDDRAIVENAISPLPPLNLTLLESVLNLPLEYRETDPVVFKAIHQSRSSYFNQSAFIQLPFAANQGTDSGKWLGANVGVSLEYHLNQKWYVASGLGYGLRRGPVGISQDHPNSIYDFEMIDHGYRMEIDHIHYGFIPFSIHRKINKLQIGLEYRMMFLLNAQVLLAEYNHNRNFSDQGVLIQTDMLSQEKGWARPEGLRQFNQEIAMSFFYQMNEKIRAGVQLSYNPLGITNEQFGLKYNHLEQKYNSAYSAGRPFLSNAAFIEFSMLYSW